MFKNFNPLAFAIFLCLTLGLTPYFPEPHVYGKIKWILGGAHGMKYLDWFDFLMHASPWGYLIFIVLKLALKKKIA